MLLIDHWSFIISLNILNDLDFLQFQSELRIQSGNFTIIKFDTALTNYFGFIQPNLKRQRWEFYRNGEIIMDLYTVPWKGSDYNNNEQGSDNTIRIVAYTRSLYAEPRHYYYRGSSSSQVESLLHRNIWQDIILKSNGVLELLPLWTTEHKDTSNFQFDSRTVFTDITACWNLVVILML